jgi:hypothetical protein
MAKPTIVTRAGKGSALTWTEGDTNLTNLRDATVTLKAGTGGTDVVSDLNGTVTLVAGTNISLSGDNTAKTVTITNTAGAGIASLSADATPTLGGDLIVNGYSIKATGSNSVNIRYGASGYFSIGLAAGGAQNWPTAEGSTGTFLKTDGAGQLSWAAPTVSLVSPGPIGSTTASTGAFTTLTASTSVSFSPSGAITLNPTTAGTINNMSIGATTASTGRFTTVQSTVTTGTAPFTVASTTNVANLNASSLNGATFSAPGAIGGGTAAAGTFTTLTSTGRTVIKDLTETIATVTYAATITPDVANGTVQKVTLTGAVTFSAFANPVTGQSLTLFVIQDATGSRLLTSTMKFSGGTKTLSTAANAVDIITVFYDGTNYYASLAKAFA